MKTIQMPLSQNDISTLRAGDTVLISGTIYTARDAAHKILFDMLSRGEPLPIPVPCCIYYAGPCPAAPGEVIGPCGPTTSARMDAYTPALLQYGVTAIIGKGPRSDAVLSAIKGKAVYFAATGGAAVLIAASVKTCELVAFPELGAEAIYKLTVVDFPAIVAVDVEGNNLYK